MKLDELINRFLAATTSGFTNETYTSYRRKLNYLREFVGGGEVDPNLITPETVEGLKLFLTSRNKKRKGAKQVEGKLSLFTVYTSLKTTKYFLEWSYQNGFIDHDPMRGIKLPSEPKPKPKAVEQVTIVKLLEAAATTGEDWERARNLALILCLCDTGARVSGLAGAELEGLDLAKGELLVTEKGEVERPVFLSPATVEILKIWLEVRQELGPLERTVFINKYGTRLTRGGIYKILRKVADAGGILDRSNPHAFRHAFAKGAIENGIDLSRLSELMGHSCEAITAKYYTRWNTSELRKAHRKFSPVNGLPAIKPKFEGRGLAL
jgi:site-specific recombinase XerD